MDIIKIVILIATIAFLFGKYKKTPLCINRRAARLILGLLAFLAISANISFFSFHGKGTYIHLHDFAHYYLGSKYYREIPYQDFYFAVIAAESDIANNRFRSPEARAIADYRLASLPEILSNKERVKAKFSPERWKSFCTDVAYFRKKLPTKLFHAFVTDHGYHGNPFSALIRGYLANKIIPGSHASYVFLALLDFFLILILLYIIAIIFGAEITLLSIIFLNTAFGASFDWIGGSYLRSLYLISTVCGFCCIKKGKYILGGMTLAAGTLLKLFPAVFIFPFLIRAASDLITKKKVQPNHLKLILSFFATIAGLFLWSGFAHNSFMTWYDFFDHISVFRTLPAVNAVGLTQMINYFAGGHLLTWEGFLKHIAWLKTIHSWQLIVSIPILTFLLIKRGRHYTDTQLYLGGLSILFCCSTLAAYYYLILIVFILCCYATPEENIPFWCVQVIPYTAIFFSSHESTPFFFYSCALLAWYIWIFMIRRVPFDNCQSVPTPV